MSTARLADPYSDLTVIDSRAPRFNQAVIGVVALIAVATGWWWLLAALAANLAAGLLFGRRFCLTCVAYFALVQPLVGEGPLQRQTHPTRERDGLVLHARRVRQGKSAGEVVTADAAQQAAFRD